MFLVSQGHGSYMKELKFYGVRSFILCCGCITHGRYFKERVMGKRAHSFRLKIKQNRTYKLAITLEIPIKPINKTVKDMV